MAQISKIYISLELKTYFTFPFLPFKIYVYKYPLSFRPKRCLKWYYPPLPPHSVDEALFLNPSFSDNVGSKGCLLEIALLSYFPSPHPSYFLTIAIPSLKDACLSQIGPFLEGVGTDTITGGACTWTCNCDGFHLQLPGLKLPTGVRKDFLLQSSSMCGSLNIQIFKYSMCTSLDIKIFQISMSGSSDIQIFNVWVFK